MRIYNIDHFGLYNTKGQYTLSLQSCPLQVLKVMIIMTVLNFTQFLPDPTISRGTASDGRIEDATSEEPNINSIPPPKTGKFTETNHWLDSSHLHLYKHLQNCNRSCV